MSNDHQISINDISLKDVTHEDWNSAPYQATLNAVTRFPMDSFCEALFSHDSGCIEAAFPKCFFEMLLKFVCVLYFQNFALTHGFLERKHSHE